MHRLALNVNEDIRKKYEFRQMGALQSGTELFGMKECADTERRYRGGRSGSICMRRRNKEQEEGQQRMENKF